jgi:heme A synthase
MSNISFSLSYLVLFFPIVLVILLVLEACRSDDPRKIAKRALANFGVLTAVLVLGGAFVFVINRWF